MIPVKSSNIKSVGYDAKNESVYVEFNNGGVYRYMGVPQVEFDKFISSPSVGRHLNTEFKGTYEFAKCEPCRRFVRIHLVEAVPALRGDCQECKEQDHGEPGYKVTYPDGYTSWCPAPAFTAVSREVTGVPFSVALEHMLRDAGSVCSPLIPGVSIRIVDGEFRAFASSGEGALFVPLPEHLLSDGWELVSAPTEA